MLDGDGRGEPGDALDFGFFHLFEKLSRVGRERFDIAPLAFGVEGIEGQGRLARSRDARDDRQLVAGNRDIDIAQVVLARAEDLDLADSALGFGAAIFLDCLVVGPRGRLPACRQRMSMTMEM